MAKICSLYTKDDIFQVNHGSDEISCLMKDDNPYIVLDKFTRAISFSGNNSDNPTRKITGMKRELCGSYVQFIE